MKYNVKTDLTQVFKKIVEDEGNLPRQHSALISCLISLNRYIRNYNHLTSDGSKICSYETKIARRKTLDQAIKQIHALGDKITNVNNLKEKNLNKLIRYWEAEGLCASTLQSRTSHLRTLCRWIGKDGMVKPLSSILENAQNGKRDNIAQASRSVHDSDIDLYSVLSEFMKVHKNLAVSFMLMMAFGLRKRESCLIKPHLADQGEYLDIYRGSKGRRRRTVKISTDIQRKCIDYAKSCVDNPNHSLIPSKYSWDKWAKKIEYRCQKLGLTKKDSGVTPHSFRYTYAIEAYEILSGQAAPVHRKDGEASNRVKDKSARYSVAEDLGHSREQILSAYIGSSFKKEKKE